MTTTQTIGLRLSHILAAAQASSNEKTRYYLNGVYIEARDGFVQYTATDGHCLFACNHDADPDYKDAKTSFILSNDDIKNLARLANKARGKESLDFTNSLRVEVETEQAKEKFESDKIKLKLSLNQTTITTEPVNGTLPDYRRVIPAYISNNRQPVGYPIITFNHTLLARLQKAFTFLQPLSVAVNIVIDEETGPFGVTSSICDRATGVIMPMRGDAHKATEKMKDAVIK